MLLITASAVFRSNTEDESAEDATAMASDWLLSVMSIFGDALPILVPGLLVNLSFFTYQQPLTLQRPP